MVTIAGIDPGPTPGAVLLTVKGGRLTGAVLMGYTPLEHLVRQADRVALERFIIGNATVRRTRKASAETIAQAHQLAELARELERPLQYLPAGQVKPWATDLRLREWGLYELTTGSGGHHRDAARHALYAAVKWRLLPAVPTRGPSGRCSGYEQQ